MIALDMKSNNMVRTTSDKQISRTFQGQVTVFKDKGLFKKSAFFIPLWNTLLAKKHHGVIYDFNFFSDSVVDHII